eukprot:3813725-Pleurochrysis_carterae.AAC.1
MRAHKRARYTNLPVGFEVAELHVSPELQFLHDQGFKASGWVRVATYTEVTSGFVSHCSREVITSTTHIQRSERDGMAPLLVCSFDIECHSRSGGFPDANRDEVVMASLNFWRHGTDLQKSGKEVPGAVHRVLLCVGTCDSVD